MNLPPDNLDDFEQMLADLRPAAPDSDLAHRLEMTLHQAEEERKRPTNIIYHPFAQWALASAAMLMALLMAFNSTRPEPNTDLADGFQQRQMEPAPVYRVVNGRPVPVSSSQTLQNASYSGIRVIDGKAYRDFRSGDERFLQPVLKGAEKE